MSEFIFDPKKLKDGITLAKTIKPESDFVIKFSNSSMIVSSMDKRRYIKVIIPSEVSSEFESSDMCVGFDRMSLLETDLSTVSITVNEKTLSVKMVDGTQTRRASITRKVNKIKTVDPSSGVDLSNLSIVDSKKFDSLLRQVSCSALVKETKTEQDMRVNQIHFYPSENCVVSNARYYGSIAYLDDMGLDLSIVSSDIPFIRAFCAKCDGGVGLFCDDNKLYVVDSISGSMIIFGKVSIPKPSLSILNSDDFSTEIHIDRDQLSKNLSWACSAIEGTQRLGVSAADNCMKLFFGQDEIASFPVEFVKGTELKSDFPLNVLMNIVSFIDKVVVFKFHHKDVNTILEVSQGSMDLRSFHYLQSMRMR
jgi:hypothetical protein